MSRPRASTQTNSPKTREIPDSDRAPIPPPKAFSPPFTAATSAETQSVRNLQGYLPPGCRAFNMKHYAEVTELISFRPPFPFVSRDCVFILGQPPASPFHFISLRANRRLPHYCNHRAPHCGTAGRLLRNRHFMSFPFALTAGSATESHGSPISSRDDRTTVAPRRRR